MKAELIPTTVFKRVNLPVTRVALLPLNTLLHHALHRLAPALICLLMATSAWGDTSLLERYRLIKEGSSATLPGTTISISSAEQNEVPSADVSSLLHYPFEQVATALAGAENWCRILPLHFNIKACTYQSSTDGEQLTLYSGRKNYQAPADSYEMSYRFDTLQRDDQRLSLRLHAESGPAGTRDYRIVLEALRVEEGTLLHIHSSYRPSTLSSLLAGAYLATLGRDKVGFSQVESGGQTVLVQGARGVIERNVMRYHIAVDTFLATRTLPEPSRHEAALSHWFRGNDRYPDQLHEMEEAEYLAIKRREWDNQQRLQQALNSRLKLAAIP